MRFEPIDHFWDINTDAQSADGMIVLAVIGICYYVYLEWQMRRRRKRAGQTPHQNQT